MSSGTAHYHSCSTLATDVRTCAYVCMFAMKCTPSTTLHNCMRVHRFKAELLTLAPTVNTSFLTWMWEI